MLVPDSSHSIMHCRILIHSISVKIELAAYLAAFGFLEVCGWVSMSPTPLSLLQIGGRSRRCDLVSMASLLQSEPPSSDLRSSLSLYLALILLRFLPAIKSKNQSSFSKEHRSNTLIVTPTLLGVLSVKQSPSPPGLPRPRTKPPSGSARSFLCLCLNSVLLQLQDSSLQKCLPGEKSSLRKRNTLHTAECKVSAVP